MLQESSLFLSTIPSLVFFGPLLCVSPPFCPYILLYLLFLLFQDVLSLYNWITFCPIRLVLSYFHHELSLLGLLLLLKPVL